MFKGKFLHGNLKNENTACDYFKGHVNENFNYFVLLYNKIHYFCILLKNSYLYSDIGFNNHYGVFSKLAFHYIRLFQIRTLLMLTLILIFNTITFMLPLI